MPQAVRWAAVAVLNYTAFVVGGQPNSCLSYDMTLDTWTILTPPAIMHDNAAAAMWQVSVSMVDCQYCISSNKNNNSNNN